MMSCSHLPSILSPSCDGVAPMPDERDPTGPSYAKKNWLTIVLDAMRSILGLTNATPSRFTLCTGCSGLTLTRNGRCETCGDDKTGRPWMGNHVPICAPADQRPLTPPPAPRKK